MVTEERYSQNREIAKNFIDLREIPKEYKVPDGQMPFGYIYCIENKKNGKKYIGATFARQIGQSVTSAKAQINKRAADYIYDYNRAIEGIGNLYVINRPIIQAMVKDGIENFVIYPLAETTLSDHGIAEKYFIKKFDTVNSGYNVQHGGAGVTKAGTPMTAAGKLSRSDSVLCINLKENKLVFADSMKLFADFVGSSKDMMKNTNRKGRTYKGWMIFYIDAEKRQYVLDKYILGNGLNDNDKHSEKSKQAYVELYRQIDAYLKSPPNQRAEYFPGFTILDRLEYIND